ncbi:uncharacterized protein AB675_6733 [Cyphellophora attinorum]|uniref:Peroxisomal membrane protein PEX14 n=1 Tax=Cyphellophora attinorum TaxID=1664694 RepID=A0A0N1P2I5_9EURO|nr:uncharacterized protein AB675_6733 [Phialophora attinorum]KPI43586.1 hypothetical protein AB675_6733 [Phialophora attinorum]
MTGDGDGRPRVPAIPSWQQNFIASQSKASESVPDPKDASEEPQPDALEEARLFLQEDEIKTAPREQKQGLLEKKGLQADDIQRLLDAEQQTADNGQTESGLKTIFDSNTVSTTGSTQKPLISPPPPVAPGPPPETASSAASVTPKQDLPPIITYPEFLLKPQKPPPLVTVDRLLNAGYILAGISALTWGASKYLVAPMLESLTSARHHLQSTTLDSLEKLNTKLESTVSHVPYIPPLSHKQHINDNDDAHSAASSDSDPTELFHRDIATQTSPPSNSRRSSVSFTNNTLGNVTITQSTQLRNLHSSLSSLLSSTQSTFASSALSDSVGELQEVIDKIESNSQPLYTSYDWRSTTNNATRQAWDNTGSTRHKPIEAQSEAAKVKAAIRSLKGALLSSHNFMSPREFVAPVAAGSGSTRIPQQRQAQLTYQLSTISEYSVWLERAYSPTRPFRMPEWDDIIAPRTRWIPWLNDFMAEVAAIPLPGGLLGIRMLRDLILSKSQVHDVPASEVWWELALAEVDVPYARYQTRTWDEPASPKFFYADPGTKVRLMTNIRVRM